jgi:hypothetical protein
MMTATDKCNGHDPAEDFVMMRDAPLPPTAPINFIVTLQQIVTSATTICLSPIQQIE